MRVNARRGNSIEITVKDDAGDTLTFYVWVLGSATGKVSVTSSLKDSSRAVVIEQEDMRELLEHLAQAYAIIAKA